MPKQCQVHQIPPWYLEANVAMAIVDVAIADPVSLSC